MSVFFLYFLLFIALAVMIVTAFFLISGVIAICLTFVPFVPTPARNVKLIIDRLKLQPGEIFYDLGCGDGRFLIAAEQRGAVAIGFEISPWAFLKAKVNQWKNRSQIKLRYKNFYPVSVGDADVVVCFLLDAVMAKVERKLEQELKPGTRVATYGFKLPSWQPLEVMDLKPNHKRFSRIYFYQKS